MKGLFITTRNIDRLKEKETGIFNKINSQYKLFEKEFDMKMLSYSKHQYFFFAFLSKIPFFPVNISWKLSKHEMNLDFVYYRFETGNPSIIRLLRRIKKTNPECKIIVEFSVYPIDWNSYTFPRNLAKYNYLRCAEKLSKIADRSVVYGDHKEAYGIPAIITQNGIDVDAVSRRIICPTDQIRLISVSKMIYWHRIDRMIRGLYEYYQSGGNRDIVFNIVGSGTENDNLRALVEELHLEKHVFFHGYKSGKELDDLFNRSDIAVDGLTDYPKQNSSLKSREYWAKGMPVVTSNIFPTETSEISKYILTVPSEDKPVELSKVLEFYESFYGESLQKAEQNCKIINWFAKNHYDMSVALEPIIKYIKI